jgi:TP901 family phage tail tape measure protein
MAKQLNISLGVTADTSQAKAQFQALQQELTKLSTASAIGAFNNADMEKAIHAAKELQIHLNKAVNIDTGKLDLSRFSASLKSANTSLEVLRKDLSLAGEQGNQAFLQLARSISQAEAPAIRMSNTLREMGNTLKNTVRWQLSSSMLHGFMGAVQSAYGYAQDLDKSLNNIRIVTGKNKVEMAAFAKEANKAAQALSATTTEYTDAALIFYQQGLSNAQVEERTQATIKMAHAAGESATEVSSYMTAIWNNFDDGSKSLEYYGDVMAHLGAKTAASSAEIAQGLEKFAAIGDTVGLSYEYAASAVATVVDKTRQSADTVGTAFKTIFARIQGLNLGETLDDGTTLNKYSQALMAVGINVKDVNGELKDADIILDELGKKWQTLARDEQMALAQTVAGTRQYTQLISLMDNYSDFKDNVGSSKGAEGTLSNQAAIYAQSWEAAQERVRAAMENVFDSLIDEDFFIDLANGMTKFINGIATVIDGLGGMQGILTLVGSLFLSYFAKEIPGAIQKVTENFNVLTGKAQKDAVDMMEQNQKALEGFTSDKMTNALDAELAGLTKVNEMKTTLAKNSKFLTEAEKQQFEQEIQMIEAASKMVEKEGEKVDAIEKEIAANERRLIADSSKGDPSKPGARVSNLNGDTDKAKKIEAELSKLKELTKEYVSCEQVLKRLDVANKTWLGSGDVSSKSMIKNIKIFKDSFIEARGGFNKLTEAEKAMCKQLDTDMAKAGDNVEDLKKAFSTFGEGVEEALNPAQLDLLDKEIADIEQTLRKMGVNNEALNNLEQQFKEGALSADEYRQKLIALQNTESESAKHSVKMSETIGAIGSTMMQVSMAANTLKNAWNIWSDEDATLGEKILTTMTALGTLIPIITTFTNADNVAKAASHALNILNVVGLGQSTIAKKINAGATAMLTAAEGAETGAVIANTAAWMSNPIGWIALVIMAVVAAIALLVAGFSALATAMKASAEASPEGRLKVLEEEAAILATNLEEATEAADSLRESIESYDSAIDKMKHLQQGTEEYKQAVREANAEARDLISQYGDELQGKYSFNAETGAIEFEEGALEDLQAKIDKQADIAQNQVIANQNAQLTAKNQIATGTAAKADNNIDGEQIAVNAANAAVAAAIPVIGPFISGAIVAGTVVEGIVQGARDSKQEEALSALQQAYEDNGGNLSAALDELSVSELALIESMGMTKDELSGLCEELRVNSEAIKENNKQIIDNALSGNEAYEKSGNKAFVNEIMADDLTDEADKLYEEKYKDKFGGKTDAEVQKAYAEMMGYDASNVENKSGNKAVYYDKDGNEIGEISDETARRALAQQEALDSMSKNVDDYVEKVDQLEQKEKLLAHAADGSIESYEEYKKAMHAYGEELGLTEAEIDKYISTYGNMQEAAKKETISKNMQSWGYSKGGSDQAVEALTKDLTDEQLQLMVDISADAASFDDFQRQFEAALNQSFVDSFQNSSANIESVLASVQENGKMTSGDLKTLEQDENFQKYLEESGKTMLDFTKANYSERLAIVNSFYADLKASEYEALENSKQSYQDDLVEYQAIIDYKRSLDENGNETAESQAIKEQFDNIDFSAYVDMDISDVQSKMDEIQNAIDDIDGQKVKLDMEWETTEALEKGMEKVSSFTKVLQNDTKKVGNQYQMTAAQAREWMQVYPEMFAEAEVTADGLISLDKDKVESFVGSQEEMTDAAIDSNIQQLESRISELEAEKLAYQADLELAKGNAIGKEELSKASAEYLADTRDKLTQYYVDCGLDEVAAQKAAMDTMGLNEAEYSELVANAATRNAENQIESSEQAATAQVGVLGKLWNKVKDWAKNVGNLFKNVWGALTGKVDWSEVWGSFSTGTVEADSGVTGIEAYDEAGNFKEGSEAARQAVLEEINSGSAAEIEAAMADIDSRIASIRAEIAYNEALKNQDLGDYGSTDPDDVDGSSDSNTLDEEELTEIFNRYHEITKEIEAQERILDRVSKAKDRAYGAEKLALMKKEQEALETLYADQEKLLIAQAAFLETDKKAVTTTFKNAQFDENGNITNYSALQKDALKELNEAEEAYNTSEQTDDDKQALEDAKKKYEDAIKVLEQYEDTLDAFEEQKDTLTETAYKLMDAKLEEIQYSVDLQVEIEDDSLKYINYLLDNLDDSAHSAAEAIALLGNSTAASMNKIATYKKGLSDIFSNHGISDETMEKFLAGDESAMKEISSKSFTEDEINAMKQYRDAIMEENQTLMGLRDTVHEKVLTAFQDLTSEMDNEISKIDHLKSVTQSYQNIIDIVGQESLGISDDLMRQMDQSTIDASANKLEASKAKLEAMQESRKKVEEELQKARESGSEESVKKWEENLAEIDGMIQDAESDFMSSWEETVQAAADAFEKEIGRAVTNFTDAMAGEAGSLAKLQDEFEKQKAKSERYLADYKQSYELAKMTRDLNNSINDTDNLKAKEAYKDLIQEIEQIEAEGRKLSEYELDNLQKRYELKQAELALEEAKNSKSQVRMSRDNEGNWGYVYTADEDKVSSALQDYEDKAYAIQEAADKYSQEMQAGAIEVAQKIADEIQNIQATYGSEEWFAEVQRITSYYQEEFGYYSEQLGIALGDLGISFSDTAYGAITGFQSMEEAQDTLTKNIGAPGVEGSLLGSLDTAYQTWKDNTERAMKAAGTSMDGFAGKVETATETAVTKSAEIREAVNTMGDDMTTIMGDVVDAAATWETEYGNKIDGMISKNDSLIESYNALLSKQAEVANSDPSKKKDGGNGDSKTNKDGGDGGDGTTTNGGDTTSTATTDRIEGVAAAIWMHGSEKSGWGTGETRKARLAEKGVSAAQDYLNANSKSIYGVWSKKTDQLKNFYYGSFDTGGYTGAWGPEGRLALLHQKELVLNARDTENMLKMVEFARDISGVIELNAMSFSQGLNSMIGTVGNIGGMDSGIHQEITIHAEFPDANNHSEIEEAFNNLLNTASQYANRNF